MNSNLTKAEIEVLLSEALDALYSMAVQYLTSGDSEEPEFDHMFMAAGEDALEVLLKHGRIKPEQDACSVQAFISRLRR